MIVKNISVGAQYQVYMHKIEINDITNNYAAIIHYNPYTDNSYSTMFKRGLSWGFGSKKAEKAADAKPERGDDIVISIVQRDPKDKTKDKELAKGEGSWLSHIIMDDQIVWRITDVVPTYLPTAEKQADGSIVLPSDFERRPDLPHMMKSDWIDAENKKVIIEQVQRNDNKLRNAALKR